jgi:hypothetical protein
MAQKQVNKAEKKLISEIADLALANDALKNELDKTRVEGTLCLNAETKRADRNREIANHNAEVAKQLRDDLNIERVGRRSLLESFRRERLELVAKLYVVDQRLRVLMETERAENDALDSVSGQVEDEHGLPNYGPKSQL